MTDFADEARSRAAHLLRMANTVDARMRAQIIEYADSTPDPPVMGPAGIATAGCPRCLRTMWRQRDGWVCASCGHVEEELPVKCPNCRTVMKSPPASAPDRWWCSRCGRVATVGDSTTEIENRERGRLEAVRLLDRAMAERNDRRGDAESAAVSWTFSAAVTERERLRVERAAQRLRA
ncbi:hypothetical protein ABZ746_13910 [Streptomyces sp. NPDC020096]|jgi:ribosomal protein S27AE